MTSDGDWQMTTAGGWLLAWKVLAAEPMAERILSSEWLIGESPLCFISIYV